MNRLATNLILTLIRHHLPREVWTALAETVRTARMLEHLSGREKAVWVDIQLAQMPEPYRSAIEQQPAFLRNLAREALVAHMKAPDA